MNYAKQNEHILHKEVRLRKDISSALIKRDCKHIK
jgi:hypothetical protein